MLIVTGSIAYDYIMDFPGKFGDHILPDQLHKINLSFLVNKFARRRGGTAGNASYSLGLLKTPHLLYSYIGKDNEEYIKAFKSHGINTSKIQVDPDNYTATGFAMTDSTHNQIWGFYTGASENNPKLDITTVAKKGDMVLIGPTGAKASIGMVEQCIKNKISYVFDPGFILTQVTDQKLTKGFINAEYVIGNDYEIQLMKERVKDYENEAKKRIVVMTIGKDGAIIWDHGKEIMIKPAKVTKPVDPTGAGDAWRSGFLAGIEKGFDLEVCGKMGAVAGAYAVEHYGTQEHSYTLEEFSLRYRKNYKDLLHL